MMTLFKSLCVFVCLCILVGCETTDTPKIKRTPMELALIEVKTGVQASKQEALEESEDRESFRFLLRYNPGRCDAPLYEVFLKGYWQRAYVLLDTPELQAGLDTLSQNNDVMASVWVEGKMTDSFKLSPRRVAWPVVNLLKVEAGSPVKATAMVKRPCAA